MSIRVQDMFGAVNRTAWYLYLLIFLMGLVASAIFLGALYRRCASYTWVDVAATIESSKVVEGDSQEEESPFHARIRFRYSFEGRSYVAEQAEDYGDYRESQKRVDGFLVGQLVTCYVNPKNPQEAVLQRPAIWIFLFPLALCAIGTWGLLSVRRRRPRSKQPEAWKESITKSRAARSSRMVLPPLYVFFSIFSLGGALGLYVCCLKPALRTVSASSWEARPCVIIASRVKTVSDSEGDLTYSSDILYSYGVGNRQYKSNLYGFWTAWSNAGYAEIEAIVAKFPPGSSCTCYVNPSDPADAVLDRGFSWNILYGLVPLIFLSIGLAGLFLLIPFISRSERKRQTAAGKWAEIAPGVFLLGTGGPVQIKPRQTRLTEFITLTIFCLIWNGFVSVFVVLAVLKSSLFVILFMIPFALVGLLMICGVFYRFLAFFIPRLRSPSVRDERGSESR